MDEEIEIILRAIDDASGVFDSVGQSAEQVSESLQTAFEEANSEVERLTQELADIEMGNIEGDFDAVASQLAQAESEAEQLAQAMDQVEQESSEAESAMTDLGIVNSSMLMQLADQVGTLGSNAEGMAQEMNTAAISVGQLATQTGIAEPQMVSLINNISNATFPNDEAMMYVKSLDQMGVASENLGQSATDLDKINDAFGLGANTVNSLGQELGVLGVDMNNVSSAFNALAYANSNTVGGMQNYFSFLRKYDAQFKELGFDVDQSSIIIAAATQKYGGGRAALSGLSTALEEADGDTRKLEEALGIQTGTLDHASEVTGQYEGQLQQLADEEAEHKTILDQIGAAWEDVSLSISQIASPLMGVIGLFGQIGQFGLQVQGIKTLIGTMRELSIMEGLLNAIEGEGAIARVASALGITTEAAAAEGATVAFGGLAIAEGAALWPILAIAAAIAALIAVVYLLGNAFGWWDDVGGMIDAIWSGIQRLWDAFINHPDVQAAISAITGALQWLAGAIGNAFNAILEFFGVSTSGEFDIVRALIDGIGLAWQATTAPIRIVIGLVQALASAFSNFYTGTLVPFGEFLVGIFTPVWTTLTTIFNAVYEYANNLITAFQQFQDGQITLSTMLTRIWNSLLTMFRTIFSSVGLLVFNFINTLTNGALTAGANFVNGVANWLMQLPGKVWPWLVQTSTKISTAGQKWVSTAKAKASQLVSGVVSYLKSLVGKAYSALIGVVSQIISAGKQWVSAAKQKAQDVVDGAYNTLSSLPGKISSALGGVVSAIVKPFQDAYNQAKALWDKISNLGGTAAGFDLNAAGFDLNAAGFDLNAAGFELPENNVSKVSVPVMVESSHDVIDVNYNISLDLQNVPSNMSTGQLLAVMEDKSFLERFVNNRDFQSIDAKVKARINQKNSRAIGR